MKKNAVVSTAVRFGVGAGILCLVWILFLYWTGQNPFGPKRVMSLFFPPLAVLLSQWYVRRFYEQGPGLGKAILTGVLTVVLTATISAASTYGLGRLGGPALMKRNYSESLQLLEGARKEFGKEMSQQAYSETKRGLPEAAGTARGVASDDFGKKLMLGLLLSIPGGVFFRK